MTKNNTVLNNGFLLTPVRELKRAGKDVWAVDNARYSIYAGSPEDFLVNGMVELIDSYERLSVILKLKRARKQKASSGNKA